MIEIRQFEWFFARKIVSRTRISSQNPILDTKFLWNFTRIDGFWYM